MEIRGANGEIMLYFKWAGQEDLTEQVISEQILDEEKGVAMRISMQKHLTTSQCI